MPTPHTQRLPVPSPRYGPALPPLRPQQTFSQPPPYDQPTSTDNYPCTDPSPRRRPRATAQEIYPVRSSPIHASQSPARHTTSPPEAHSPHPPADGLTLSRQHAAFHTGHEDPISDSTSLQTLLALISFRLYTCQRESIIPPFTSTHVETNSQFLFSRTIRERILPKRTRTCP